MADTRRTDAALATLFADNTSGAISAQDLRDFLESRTVHVATAAPTASDDETAGFDVGHVWKNTASTPDSFHMCMDASTGAAVWVQIYPGEAVWGNITGTIGDQTDLAAVASTGAADDVSYDNASSGLTATDVQTALDELATSGGGSGDVTGPASSTAGNFPDFDDTTGKVLGDSGVGPSDFATAAQGALADSAVQPGDPVSTNAQTGTSYTLVLGDAGKLVTLNNGSAITLTIPTNASVAFSTGVVIAVAQLGAGTVTVQGDTGVTVNGTSAGSEDLSAQYATATLTKLGSDTWLVSGSLA